MPVLEAKHVEKSYSLGRRKVPVLRDISLSIEPGELVAVMGPSGCGKTTLINCLSGLDTVDSGQVLLGGQDWSRMGDRKRTRVRGEKVGFVFQAFHLIPVLTAIQNVQIPLELRGMRRSKAQEQARAALDSVAVGDQAGKRPVEMSGGQQQRVAIARALVAGPSVIFADEPTGNLDSETGREVLEVFQELNERGTTFVIVTHDPQVASRVRRIVHMDSGRIAQDRRRVKDESGPGGATKPGASRGAASVPAEGSAKTVTAGAGKATSTHAPSGRKPAGKVTFSRKAKE